MTSPTDDPATFIRRHAHDLGFAVAGFTDAAPIDRAEYVRQWLEDGAHGEMRYLADHVDIRLNPDRLLPGAKTIICLADRYEDAPQFPATSTPAGRIARYAWGDDYHKVMKKRLYALADAMRTAWPDHAFRACVDTAPLLEREYAAKAGVGWIGKHTLVIHPKLGSWLLLGEIVTTMQIAPSNDPPPPADTCGTCTRCIDACPTQCITPYQLDATRCISYLTLEHRSTIDPSHHRAMGDWIAGCDICQEVCPFNQPTQARLAARLEAPINSRYAPRPPAPAMNLLEILDWNVEARINAFTRSSLKRISLIMLKRNALIALGNHLAEHPDERIVARIRAIAEDLGEEEMVRETAEQIVAGM